MSNDPVYEDIEEDGLPSQELRNSIEKKAREGKTPLQVKALQATGRKYFASSRQHKQFKGYEALGIGADPESRIRKAWFEDRIGLAVKYKMTMEQLIASFGNAVKFDVWQGRNREKVLAKPTTEELIIKLGTGKASNLPVKSYHKSMTDELDALIAELENGLGINIIRTMRNLEAAQNILNDGRNMTTWLEWCKSDKWRAEHLNIYANVQKIWETWPQAFAQGTDGLDPQGLGIS